MECKFFSYNNSFDQLIELIDTLWNVNDFIMEFSINICVGINRYIMECKYICNFSRGGLNTRINRYIMECKYIFRGKRFL